jgi:branched-subunit amino acid permease
LGKVLSPLLFLSLIILIIKGIFTFRIIYPTRGENI